MFYINLPVAFAALVLLVIFLHVEYERDFTWIERLKRIDTIGNAIFVAAIVALLFALTNGGTLYAWSSWRVIVPLVVGFVGIGLFAAYELSRFCREPSLSRQLFANRTSATAYVLTFLHTMFMYWQIYFMPVYFQGVLGSSPMRSGVQLLPTVINLMAFAAVGGGAMEKFGRYRPIHAVGFALMTIGFGIFTLLTAASGTAVWVVSQLIYAAGAGLAIGTLLPAVQAELSESDTATATGTWAVLRSFGTIWGITISAALFNNRCAQLSGRVKDPAIRALLSGGHGYEHATRSFLTSVAARNEQSLKSQVISVYQDSLKLIWQVAIGIAGVGFLLVFLQREVTMRTDIDTEFGMAQARSTGEKEERSLAKSAKMLPQRPPTPRAAR